jgi:DtxR family Mn-dependent transcriptional regulator
MKPALTFACQDYLKNIFALEEGGTPVHTSVLAHRLGVSPASVTGMLQKLGSARPALIEYKKHQGVKLTRRGRLAALEVIRHHRLLEAWLTKELGYTWDEVHGEAEKLEHAISEELEKRISDSLGDPARDPHGEPIPSASLVMPKDRTVELSRLTQGQEAIVRRVRADDVALLKHLQRLGVLIGTRVTMLTTNQYDQVMRLKLKHLRRTITLGPAITGRVYVETMGAPRKTIQRRQP